jgi:hypothetical protein
MQNEVQLQPIQVFYGNSNITNKLNKGMNHLSSNNAVLDKLFGDTNSGINKCITINNVHYMTDVYVDLIKNKVYTHPPNLIPITFSFPEEKIINQISSKDKLLSSIIPGNSTTYIYNSEKEYYDEYKRSYFALTKKKAGWDCMRHYEIIANGCIPLFENIEQCPKNCMSLLPKDLIKQGNELYLKSKETLPLDEWTKLVQLQMNYMREHLTTKKVSQYILNKSGHTNVKKILYLSGNLYSDYLRCLCLHGFKELIGSECHDYPKIPHMYKNHNVPMSNMWGKGFTYNGLIDNELHNDDYDKTIQDDIKDKKYDIIIYGSLHRGLPLYDLCNMYYKSNEIIFLCGEDEHICNCHNLIEKGHYVFVRELC